MNTGLTLLAAVLVTAAPGPRVALRAGAIGAVRVVGADASSYTVELVFPLEEVSGFGRADLYGKWSPELKVPVRSPGTVLLFDAAGPLGAVPVGPPNVVFWCENDGGPHFHAAWIGKVPRQRLRRPLRPVVAIQGLAAFARVAGSSRPAFAPPLEGRFDVALEGDVDGDGTVDARIVTAPNDAGCDGEPENNLSIALRSSRGGAELRCCGP